MKRPFKEHKNIYFYPHLIYSYFFLYSYYMDIKKETFSRFFVRNCEFKFSCHQNWEGLEQKAQEDTIRYCSECKKDVHMVENAWELVLAIEKNYCVAVPRTEAITAEAIINRNKPLLGHVAFKK